MTKQVLQANWIAPSHVDEWLRKMIIGRSLNVCCGTSLAGDVRLDILPPPETTRTEEGDLFNLGYKARSFDTVICDPPFTYYNKRRWVFQLAQIACKRLILSSNQMVGLQLKNWDRRLFYDDGGLFFIRLFWVFDRLNHELKDLEVSN
jgi:hypothetical protein